MILGEVVFWGGGQFLRKDLAESYQPPTVPTVVVISAWLSQRRAWRSAAAPTMGPAAQEVVKRLAFS